jgi:hypothetical protein
MVGRAISKRSLFANLDFKEENQNILEPLLKESTHSKFTNIANYEYNIFEE